MKVTMKCETLRLGVLAYVYVSYKSSYTYEFKKKLSVMISGVDYKGSDTPHQSLLKNRKFGQKIVIRANLIR